MMEFTVTIKTDLKPSEKRDRPSSDKDTFE